MFTSEFLKLKLGKLQSRKSQNSRYKKWLAMLYQTKHPPQVSAGSLELDDIPPLRDSYDPKRFAHKKMRRRIRKGIPNELRSSVWQLLSGSSRLMSEQPDLYESLVKSKEKSSQEVQIMKDVRRTFQSATLSEHYQKSISLSLFHVLRCFALHCEEIGYCQGMNNVAALMLCLMNEEETFWMLVSLAENPLYNMKGCWLDKLPLVRLRFYQLVRILANTDRKLYKHMHENNFVDPALYGGTSFFIDPFLSNRTKGETILRIWDVYLSEGFKWILKLSIAIIRECRKELLKHGIDNMKKILFDKYKNLDINKTIKNASKIRIPSRTLRKLEKDFNTKEKFCYE